MMYLSDIMIVKAMMILVMTMTVTYLQLTLANNHIKIFHNLSQLLFMLVRVIVFITLV